MMHRTKIYLTIGGIGLLLVVLVAIQITWLREAAGLQAKETKMHVVRALEQAEEKLRNTNYCFEMYGKTYISPDEIFYIARQKRMKNGKAGPVDTIQMFYDMENFLPDSVSYSARTLQDNWPVAAEIRLNFTATQPSDTDKFYEERKAFYERTTGKKMRDVISNNKPVETVFDMKAVDSILSKSLKTENVNDRFGFAFIAAKTNSIAYAHRVQDSNALLHSPYSISLFSDNKFLTPYRLALVFPLQPSVQSSDFWLLLSLFIIVVLILAFYFFITLYFRQARLSEMKSDFINNLTHEFNTPMANISLAIESLDENGQARHPKLKRMLDIISSESVRLRENIEKALQVVTMEKGKMQLAVEDVDLVEMINTVLETYRLKCEQLGGSISFLHPPQAMMQGDETHLLNCICNLLDNAVKYRRDIPLIEILLAESPDYFGLSITDNGIGMTSDTQKYIFEKFYRAHTGVRHDTKGFGLGLSYVKGIIETHGGRVAVESKKGEGTRFMIQLPKSLISGRN